MLGMVALLLVVLAGMWISRDSWWVLAWTLPAALLFGRLGFAAHDATHSQVFASSRKNYALSLALFNLCLGGSRGWWANKHNAHHAQPNRLLSDPDIEGGLIAVSPEQAVDVGGFTRAVMRRQGVVIWPLLSLAMLQTGAYSVAFALNRSRRNAAVELLLILVHYAVYFGGLILVLGVGRGLLFALIHQMLFGLYMGGAFLPNHIGMAVLQPDDEMDFLRRQVLTTRNLRVNVLTRYLFGGLSGQIEHHLFPAMPRSRLRETAVIVRSFCEEHCVEYRETGVWEAYVQVYRQLRFVAQGMSSQLAAASA
jgi:fatty acid desaturase